MTLTNSVLDTARALQQSLISFVPIDHRTKRPSMRHLPRVWDEEEQEDQPKWDPFQHRHPTQEEIGKWFVDRQPAQSVAVVCGKISGGLLVLDFDSLRFYEAWVAIVGNGIEGLVIQKTGGGGRQVFLRCANPGKNDKLAWEVDTKQKEGRKVAIETRGEGGYAVAPGSLHPTGNRYELLSGSLTDIPTIAQARADALVAAARKLCECPLTKKQMERAGNAKAKTSSYRGSLNGQGSVIDEYCKRYSLREVLRQHGYSEVGNRMIRPDADADSQPGVSFFDRDGRDVCYCWSSNDVLNDGHAHDAFSVFCELSHAGDYKKAVKEAAELMNLAIHSSRSRKTASSGIVSQIIARGRQLPEVTAEVLNALAAANHPPIVFTRGGAPARIRVNDKEKPVISQMNEAAMRGQIARSAEFFAPGKGDSLTPIVPPLDVVRDVMALDLHQRTGDDGSSVFPTIEAITEIPVIRPDWSIITQPGYDRATRLYYSPPAFALPTVSEHPTPGELRESINLLDEAIGEFPYESDADRANAFGTLLTPPVRHTIEGKSPLAIFDAPQAGTGKSLLAEVIGKTVTGDSPAMMGAPENEAEWRKQITSTLLDGPTVIVIDNIDSPLTSASLARALTAKVWSDRILSTNQQAALIQSATWIGTGNNVELGGDMPRRCYRVRLDAKTARPWRGRTFRHPNLLEWIEANRGRLIWALLTVCRAWHVAGRPIPAELPIIGSFEGWSKTIGAILHFAGVSGFLANLDELYEQADDGAAEWERFLRAWYAHYGGRETLISRVVADLQSVNGVNLRESLPEGLGGFVVFQPGSFMQAGQFVVKDAGRFKIRLGKQLRRQVGRRYGVDGLHLSRREDLHAKTAVWRIEFAGSTGSGGSAGSLNPEPISSHTPTSAPVCVLDVNTPATSRTPRNEKPDADAEERAAIADPESN